MEYARAVIVDHGSIARHTFTNAGGGSNDPTQCQGVATPPKDTNACKYDCFGEYSCS
jgi:hypothetical protein